MFTKKIWIFWKYWKCLPRKCGFFGNTGNVYQENVDFFLVNTRNVYEENVDIFGNTRYLPRKCRFFGNTGNVYEENVDFFEILEMFTK